MLICNKCKHKLTDAPGCVFCKDFKNNYLAMDDEKPVAKLIELGTSTLRLIEGQLLKFEKFARSEKEFNPELNTQLFTFVKTVTTLTDSVRKLKEAEEEQPDLDYTEKISLFIEELMEMPVLLRKKAVEKIFSNCAVSDGLQ